MNLHLFSSPGENDIRYIIEACRPYLKDKDDPVVAFMPLASFSYFWQDYTEKAFRGLARIELINTEMMELSEMETTLRRAQVVYISGGNTYLLNHRLHISRLMPHLRKKVQTGLPVVAFSAGTIFCGPNILTSNDMNMVETTHFSGLNVTPFNFYVHYANDAYSDEWLNEYFAFHENSILILADGAYIKVQGKKTTLVRGEAWILRKDSEKEKLEEGNLIIP